MRDTDDADGRLIPEQTRLKFGDGDVEGGAKSIFETARNLTLIFERVRAFDPEFEREEGNHEHVCRSMYIVTLANRVGAASHT